MKKIVIIHINKFNDHRASPYIPIYLFYVLLFNGMPFIEGSRKSTTRNTVFSGESTIRKATAYQIPYAQ
jgi:hypothetical protein